MIRALLSALTLFILPILFGWFAMNKPPKQHMYLLMITALMSYMIWRFNSPYPFPLNWDIWEHQTAINAIVSGKNAMLPSLLSDTFGFTGYTTLFHYLIAGVQYLWRPDTLGFWWFAELYMVFFTGIVTYAVSFAMTEKRLTAIVAGILSSFLFASTVAFTPLFLIPQTIAACVWTLGLTALIRTKKAHRAINTIVFYSLLTMLFHGIVGCIGTGLYILWYIGRFTPLSETTKRVLSVVIPCSLFFGLLAITALTPIGSLNHGEAAAFMTPFADKLAALRSWSGFFFFILTPIGAVRAIKTWQKPIGYLTVFLGICIGAIVVSPMPYAMKFIVLARFLVIPLYAEAIVWIRDRIPQKVGKTIFLYAFFVIIAIIYTANTGVWKQTVLFRGVASQLSNDERAAALFLKQTYGGKQVMLISDPSTSYILEGISGINSPGGAYMNSVNRHIITQLPDAYDGAMLASSIGQIRDGIDPSIPSTYLWVVSARYFSWIHQPEAIRDSFAFNTWTPQALSLEDTIDIRHMETIYNMQPVFSNDSMAIFAVQPTL